MPAAAIVLIDSDGRDRAHALSDSAGMFELRAPKAEAYRLRVDLIGYVPFVSDPLKLQKSEAIQVEIRLSTEAIPLEPLVIIARIRNRLEEFEKRYAHRASGYFLTQQDIDRRIVMQTSSLLFGVPGVTLLDQAFGTRAIVLPDHSSVRARCAANIFVDGMPIMSRISVDDILDPTWIGGVEIYPRRETAPIEYRGVNSCGVVLFWTREPERGSSWSWVKLAVAGGFLALALRATR